MVPPTRASQVASDTALSLGIEPGDVAAAASRMSAQDIQYCFHLRSYYTAGLAVIPFAGLTSVARQQQLMAIFCTSLDISPHDALGLCLPGTCWQRTVMPCMCLLLEPSSGVTS